jgi:hypothetical protein
MNKQKYLIDIITAHQLLEAEKKELFIKLLNTYEEGWVRYGSGEERKYFRFDRHFPCCYISNRYVVKVYKEKYGMCLDVVFDMAKDYIKNLKYFPTNSFSMGVTYD